MNYLCVSVCMYVYASFYVDECVYVCVCVLVHVHMYAHRDQRPVLGVIPQLPPALFSSETGSLIDPELAKWISLAGL